MKRTTIFIEPGTELDLQALARRDNRPVAALVREALAEYVAARKQRGLRLPAFAAVGASGRADTAGRHEKLLWRDTSPHDDAEPPRRRGSAAHRTMRVAAARAGANRRAKG